MILRVLFLSHCPSENTAELRDAALGGIESLNLEGIEVISKARWRQIQATWKLVTE